MVIVLLTSVLIRTARTIKYKIHTYFCLFNSTGKRSRIDKGNKIMDENEEPEIGRLVKLCSVLNT